MKQPVLFYDVTQLVHWQGELTGIPKVMYELAVRYQAETEQPVAFVAWVKELQDFCEVNLGETLAHRGHGIAYLKKGQPSPSPLLLSQLIHGQSAQPQPATGAAPLAKKVAKTVLHHAARVSPGVADGLKQRIILNRFKTNKRADFQPGDKLFIPWGEWWDQNFITSLQALHQQNIKLIPIIHDIGPMVMPELSGHSTDSLTAYCAKVVPISSLVLAVSQNTKKDLEQWLEGQNLAVPPIEVFRLGDNVRVTGAVKPKEAAFRSSGLRGNDFILCVGTIEAKKNHALFYYVYNLARQRNVQLPKIVMVGRRGWRTENIFEIMLADLEKRFVFLNNASDEELSWLYDHCLFTVLPSFYEGWGIPIAESVRRGVPCLASNTSSMVEIAPGITEHFSPYSSEECLAAIARWCNPAELKKARERAKKYQPCSWDNSFQQVKQFVEAV